MPPFVSTLGQQMSLETREVASFETSRPPEILICDDLWRFGGIAVIHRGSQSMTSVSFHDVQFPDCGN